jgi:hypothetical protein
MSQGKMSLKTLTKLQVNDALFRCGSFPNIQQARLLRRPDGAGRSLKQRGRRDGPNPAVLAFAQTTATSGEPEKKWHYAQVGYFRTLPRFKNTTGQLEILAFNQAQPP